MSLLASRIPGSELAMMVRHDGVSFQVTAGFKGQLAQAAGNDITIAELDSALAAAHIVHVQSDLSHVKQILAVLTHGSQLMRAGSPWDYYRAELQFRKALSLDPANPWLLLPLGAALTEEYMPEAGERKIRQALEAMPNVASIHILLAWALMGEGRKRAAIAELHIAVQDQPLSGYVYVKLAEGLIFVHDFSSAEHELKQAYKRNPSDAWTLMNMLGVILYASGDFNNAVVILRRTVALNPPDPKTYIDLAMVLQKSGHLHHAIKVLRSALNHLPGSVLLHYQLAEFMMSARQDAAATRQFEQCLRLNPNFAYAYSELGYIQKHHGHLKVAISDYRKAIQLQPKLAVAHANLAVALLAAGQHAAADKEMLAAYELDPNNPIIDKGFSRLPERYKELTTQPVGIVHPPSVRSGKALWPYFLYWLAPGGQRIPLEIEAFHAYGKPKFFGGINGFIYVIGEKSTVRLPATAGLSFVMRTNGTKHLGFRLLRLHPKNGWRSLHMKSHVVPTINSSRPGVLQFTESKQDHFLRLSIPYVLVPGQYCFSAALKMGIDMFCFATY